MKILLVEDHKLLARSLKQALEEDGFAVDLAVAGDEADAKARGAIYDVVNGHLHCYFFQSTLRHNYSNPFETFSPIPK